MFNKSYQKYVNHRHLIKDGDIILFRGTSLLAKLIQIFDRRGKERAYFSHTGIAFWSFGRLMVIDSLAKGVRPDYLSNRFKKSIFGSFSDFSTLRIKAPQQKIYNALVRYFERSEGRKYDFLLLPRIALYRTFGLDLKRMGDSDNRDICSMSSRAFALAAGIKCYENNAQWVTPQDFIRLIDKSEVSIEIPKTDN